MPSTPAARGGWRCWKCCAEYPISNLIRANKTFQSEGDIGTSSEKRRAGPAACRQIRLDACPLNRPSIKQAKCNVDEALKLANQPESLKRLRLQELAED